MHCGLKESYERNEGGKQTYSFWPLFEICIFLVLAARVHLMISLALCPLLLLFGQCPGARLLPFKHTYFPGLELQS